MVKIYKEETTPRQRAGYSIYLSVLLFLYLAGIIASALGFLFLNGYKTSPYLFMFFIFPFVIGNFASYQKLKLFTIIQTGVFLLSLFYIIYLYVNFNHV